jgi:cytochrome c oxidase cbb3-type subunit 2
VKGNFVFFLGLFFALGISWVAIVLGSNAQLGALAPYFDDNQGTAFPQWFPGVASRGQRVYRDLGCAQCHTQQVRRPGFGSDKDRGWGDRQSVARDYIYEPFPQLGLSRIGPDLANIGDRKPTAPDEGDLLNLLYSGSGGMPSFRFLFEERRVGSGAQQSDMALKLTGPLEPKPGWEIVPTQRAKDLVGYLVNLKSTYDYPEAVPFVPPKPEGAEPAKSAAAPAASAAPAPPGGSAPAPAAGGTPAPSPGGATPAPKGGASPTPTATGAAAPAPGGATPSPTGAAAAPASGTPAPSPGGAAPAPAAAGAPAPSSGGATPAPTGGAAPASAATVTPTPAAAAPAAGATPSPSPTGAAPAASGAATPTPTTANAGASK